MTGRFGPQTAHVEAFICAVRNLTEAEAENINSAVDAARWYAARDPARLYAARDAARDAARRGTARDAAWYAARDAAWSAAREDSLDHAGVAAWYAAQALVVADLVGQHGLTREHLDPLVGPCRTVPRLAAIIDTALTGTGEVAS